MKWVSLFFAVYWASVLGRLVFTDYEPSAVTAGCAFSISILANITWAADSK